MKACSEFLQTVNRLRTRRETLSGLARLAIASASSALLPSLVPRVALGSPGAARDVLICIFLRGGADGLSIVAPYGDDDYYANRPTLAIPKPTSSSANKGLNLNGYFAMHPSLAGLKELYDAGSLAVVHATGSVDPTRSHFDAERFMEQATPGDKTKGSGWIARHLASLALQNAAALRAVGFGDVPISLRGVPGVNPVAIDSIDYFGLDVDDSQAAAMQTALAALYGTSNPTNILGVQAKLAFDTINQLGTLDLETYQPENDAVYRDDSYFAYGLKQTALLLKSNLGLEVACLDMGSWDTHEHAGTNDGYLRDELKELSDGIAAFVKDLGTARMANVTIVTMSEFGRRVEENASQGTDHGHGNVMFLAGGGVNGGHVYGTWPTLAPDKLDDGDVQITTDQRAILWELASKRLGNTNFASTFPDYNDGTPPSAMGIFR